MRLFLLLALALAPSAGAQEPHGTAVETPSHPVESHAASAGHGPAEGEHGGEHGPIPTADDDHDGTPNWRDPMNGEEPNEGYTVMKLVQHAFNLAVLLGTLGYFLRRPLADALKNRAAGMRKEITEAARLRDEAQRKHAEIEARLANFESEVAAMRAQADADAKLEEERLVERARVEAERIRQSAERNIRDEVTRARFALRAEAVELAVQLAEQSLKSQVQIDDQRRLARQFLDSLKAEG